MDSDVISIVVNGEPMQVPLAMTVSALLSRLKLRPEQVAVEVNGTVVARRDFATHPLAAEARLEIVHFVGGG